MRARRSAAASGALDDVAKTVGGTPYGAVAPARARLALSLQLWVVLHVAKARKGRSATINEIVETKDWWPMNKPKIFRALAYALFAVAFATVGTLVTPPGRCLR